MPMDKCELAWKQYTELRKEILDTKQARIRVIGYKITLVSAGIAVIAAAFSGKFDLVPLQTLVIPAFAAVFFDILINSLTISIKRNGCFCRDYLEPILKDCADWPSILWEEFMIQPGVKEQLAFIGNFGLTALASIIAIVALFYPFDPYISTSLMILLVVLLVYDFWTCLLPDKKEKEGFAKK